MEPRSDGSAPPYPSAADIENWFTYHSPTAEQGRRYVVIRDTAKVFAYCLLENCPQGADRTAAIRLLRQTVMTANQAIACE